MNSVTPSDDMTTRWPNKQTMPVCEMLCDVSQREWLAFAVRRLRVALIILLPVLSLLVGCHISAPVHQRQSGTEIRQQNKVATYPILERLTYRQHLPSQQNPGYQSPQFGRLFSFLNPFKTQSKQQGHDGHFFDSYQNPGDGATNLLQCDSEPTSQETPVGLPTDTQKNAALPHTTVLRDDPPEIVEFASILNETDYFTPEQKVEIIALLRQETPTMRSCIMANHLAAIRSAGGNQRLADSVSNPIMQVSHTLAVDERDSSEPPIRLSNHSGADVPTAGLAATSDASYPGDNAQGMIRQVAGQSTRTNATFRMDSPQIDPESIPQISTDTVLPTVATPQDFTTLHPSDSSPPIQDAPVPPNMTSNLREVLPPTQSQAPTAPVIGEREITPYQVTGNRLANRDMGTYRTKINFVDYNARLPRTLPSLTAVEGEENDAMPESDGDVSDGLHDRFSPRETVRNDREYNAGDSLRDEFATMRIQNVTPIFPQEHWNETARRALNMLSMQVAASESLNDKERLQDEINLRLMNLTLGNQHDAINPIEGLPTELQEFWRNTLLGLSTMLDDVSNPDAASRFDMTQQYLQTANLYLQNLCPVQIRNQCFINQCDGFGVYEKASNDFRRGEPIFIYAEIDNLTCRESDEGFHIQVNSSYEIVDVFGNKVANGEFSQTGKSTQSRIRDVFLLWRVDLPENIMPGKFFIRLYVVDTNHPNPQFDQESLELNVLSPLSNR